MYPRLALLLDTVASQRRVLLDAVAAVPEPFRDARVDPETWSIAEVLEHLHRVERGIARLLQQTIERGRAAGIAQECETGSLLNRLDAYDLLRRDRHMRAPDPVSPRGEYTAAEGWAALAVSREILLNAIRSGDGLALGELTFEHPLLGSLDLYQWILFVGQHEARHAQQIAEIGRKRGGPTV
jgi:DinB superfamily